MNRMAAPAMPPRIWAIQYFGTSEVGMRPAAQTPMVTAGLMWQPDTWPMP